MKVCFEMTEMAFMTMSKIAEAWGDSTDEYIAKKFERYAEMVIDPKKLEDHLKHVESIVNRDKVREYYKKYKWKEYRLKNFSEREYLKIGWRNAPIIDTEELDLELKKNIGKYYYKVSRVKTNGVWNTVSKTKYTFRSSLKMLKKAINNELKYYGYAPMYKVRERKVA
jgi:hypothetical protein